MKNILKRCVSLSLAIFIMFSLSGCANDETVLTFLNFGKTNYAADNDVDGIVCENENFSLLWDDQNKRVSFLDKSTNTVWGQTPEEVLQTQQETGVKLPQLNSAIIVAYQDPVSMDEINLYSYTDAFENGEITVKRIDDGIRVIYYFSEFEFAVPVEYLLTEESFDVRVIPAHISQGEKYKVSSIKVAPFICGVSNNAENSWLFIPDGSGAVVEPFTSDVLGVFGESEVYGHDLTTQLYGYGNKKQQVNMPVYGVKKGDNALLAVIDSSASAASIEWELGSNTYGCSTVYPTFRLRGTNLISRPSNFISITTLAEINIFTQGILKKDIRVKYYPLSQNDATIAGMAGCYRDYLIKYSGLEKGETNEKTASLKFVGGVVQPEFILGIPSSKLFALTNTNSVATITKELTEKIGTNVAVQLVGYGKSGIDVGQVAGGYKTASVLGGNSGMKQLNSQLRELGVATYMDFDLITFNKSGNGFNKNSSATYEGGQLVTYTSFDSISHVKNDDRFYVLSRANLLKAAEKLIEKSPQMHLSGISLSGVSNTSYSDYALQDYYACGKIEEDVSAIFTSVKNGGYKVLSSAANIYAAISSDEIIDAPIYSSAFNFASYDVPFYQMVLKGYIPMSSVSLNLCTNQKEALLRCVSAGISPSYTIIENYDNELVTSPHSFMNASVYNSIKENIVNDINSISSYLESVKDAEIVEFTEIDKDIFKTKFSNGVVTVVNYSDADYEGAYGKVTANSWISGRYEN